MGRLALIAMLLVAFSPSISRILASGTTEVLDGWSQLCTSMGLKALPSGDGFGLADAPMSKLKLPAGQDCDYCPLAASLPMMLLALVFVLPILGRHVPRPRLAPRLRIVHNLRGLGSRGPPILL